MVFSSANSAFSAVRLVGTRRHVLTTNISLFTVGFQRFGSLVVKTFIFRMDVVGIEERSTRTISANKLFLITGFH